MCPCRQALTFGAGGVDLRVNRLVTVRGITDNERSTMTTPNERAHPLDAAQYACPYNNWHQLRTQWNGELSPDQRMAVLHTGLFRETGKCEHDEPSYSRIDVLVFYLQHADGWRFESNFASDLGRYPMTRENGESAYVTRQEVSHALACKAFAMLATKVFQPFGARPIEDVLPAWPLSFASEKALKEIVHFFRTAEGLFGYCIDNLGEHTAGTTAAHVNQAKGFLIKLVEVLWAYEGHARRYPGLYTLTEDAIVALIERVEAVKPWSIRIMDALGRYDLLGDYSLNDACVAQLKEIAMRSKVTVRGVERPVRTVREAFAVGCPAAAVLERKVAAAEAENSSRKKRRKRSSRSRSAAR